MLLRLRNLQLLCASHVLAGEVLSVWRTLQMSIPRKESLSARNSCFGQCPTRIKKSIFQANPDATISGANNVDIQVYVYVFIVIERVWM
jgi:hypothetical protein